MTATRKVTQVLRGRPTLEGAGLHLKRAFLKHAPAGTAVQQGDKGS
jgi:hypothetical protein